MIHRSFVLVLLALVLALPATAQDVQHPRLWLAGDDVTQLRTLVNTPGTMQAQAYALMKARVDQPEGAYGEGNSEYRFSYRAQEAAMLAVLASDKAEQKKYADIAYDMIGEIYASKYTPLEGSGLARAMQSKGLAVSYDWLHDIWTPEQVKDVEGKIDTALDAWTKFGHANLGAQKASNWVAVTRGGEMMLLLARGGDKTRADRYKRVKGDLLTHIRNGYGSLGVSQEGIGYTEYPGGFLLPAVLAARDAGDAELFNAAQKKDWPTLAMYAHSFQGRDRKMLMTGVAHSSNYNEGWASLLMGMTSDEQRPYFTWWYDRHMGAKSVMGPNEKFDGERAGTLWALVYYPHDPRPKDPTGVLPPAVGDDRGHYFFRNRWQDADDILTSVMADKVNHDKAWDQSEALAINLMAYDARFIGGPGKTRESNVFSTLLVDPAKNDKWGGKGGKATGQVVAFDANEHGGYAIVGGGAVYKNVGVDDVKRHTLVRFSDPKTNAAVISTLDRIQSTGEHEYVWQANLGSEEDDGGIKVETGSESGRPTFTLRGGDKGFVKGWVVAPADAKLGDAGDPVRITTTGSNADIWVVLYTGQGEPPSASVTGQGLESSVTLGKSTLRYDAATERLSVGE